jgi:hypothetical protein
MKKLSLVVIMGILASLSCCQVIGGIFKAGVGVGVFLVILVIAIIIFVVSKIFGGGK